MTRRSIALMLVLATAGAAACSRDGSSERGWTTTQAEAISSVRGLPVRVRSCQGIGPARDRRYTRLACTAGARLPREDFETVAVSFEVVPSSGDAYELENVRFFSGPGIP